jgi:hypothetical protein
MTLDIVSTVDASKFDNVSKFDIENFNTKDVKVFIANKSGHCFKASEKYGEPVFVTVGLVDRFALGSQARYWMKALLKSSSKDYILITSLTILTSIGCALFGWMHGRINLLLFRNNKYIARTIIFEQLLQSMNEKEALNEHG